MRTRAPDHLMALFLVLSGRHDRCRKSVRTNMLKGEQVRTTSKSGDRAASARSLERGVRAIAAMEDATKSDLNAPLMPTATRASSLAGLLMVTSAALLFGVVAAFVKVQ